MVGLKQFRMSTCQKVDNFNRENTHTHNPNSQGRLDPIVQNTTEPCVLWWGGANTLLTAATSEKKTFKKRHKKKYYFIRKDIIKLKNRNLSIS